LVLRLYLDLPLAEVVETLDPPGCLWAHGHRRPSALWLRRRRRPRVRPRSR
jgi:hypothetical protein